MHSISVSAASGTGARRISRWHPYHSTVAVTPSASLSSTSESGGTHASLFAPKRCTLSSSLYAPSPVSIRAEHPTEPTSASPSADATASNQTTQPTLATTADRATYARCIVDRAVKTLTEKWLPVAYGAFPPVAMAHARDPGVIAPNGATAQPSTSSSLCLAAPDLVTPSCEGSQLARYPYQSTAEHMPLKQFMHEVLRRSRTSCTSLQIALCYVEAVAAKLPVLVEEEMCRIARLASGETHDENASAFPVIPIESALGLEGSNGDTTLEVPVALPPLPSLPSPLLCPRRTFLASVLLASKFLQDRSYSNKAWGKLTGLAPREVGRCERALSAALEWRLWVGKGQDSPFPVDFMDDGGPVIPTDSPFTPDAATTDSPVTLVQPQSIPAEAPRDNRLRKTKSEALVRCGRAPRRVGASASWTAPSPSMASASSACSFAAGPSRPPRARTAPWTGEVISPSTMVIGSVTPYLKTPLLDALPTQLLRDPTLADWASVSSSSLSPPGSLIHTQSSVASIASFPELSTPPDMFTVPHGNALKWTAGQCNARDGFFGIGDGVPTIDIVGSDWY